MKRPVHTIQIAAAASFILFGLWGLYEYLPEDVLNVPGAVSGLAAIALAVYWLGRDDIRRLTGQTQAPS